MKLTVTKHTTRGRRGDNQDRLYTDEERGVFAVLDGMGGTQYGGLAAQLAVEQLQCLLEECDALATAPRNKEELSVQINDLLQGVNVRTYRGLLQQGQSQKNPSGTTLTLLWFLQEGPLANCVAVAHVGDSRAYRWREGLHQPLEQLTQDQGMGHYLRNAVGWQHPLQDIELSLRTVRPQDRFLLCSDGLLDSLPADGTGEGWLVRWMQDKTDAQQMCERAVLWSYDNISAVVVEMGE